MLVHQNSYFSLFCSVYKGHFVHFRTIKYVGTAKGLTAKTMHPTVAKPAAATDMKTKLPKTAVDLTATLATGLSGNRLNLQPRKLYLL